MQRHGAQMISTHWIKQIIGCDIPKYFNEIFLLNGEGEEDTRPKDSLDTFLQRSVLKECIFSKVLVL